MKRIVAFLIILLIMISVFAVTASAIESPTKIQYYSITVGLKGDGYVETNRVAIEKDSDDIATITAKEGTSKFLRWEIQGDCTIVEGTLTDLIIKVKPQSDIVATAVFEGESYKNSTIIKTDRKPIAPNTGVAVPMSILITTIALAAAGLSLSIYNLIKKNK